MNKEKIKYYANQIIKLADESSGLVKQYPAYRIPDLSRLKSNISRDWIWQLWSNFFNPQSQWLTWEAIQRHGTEVMGFSSMQIKEIGEALGFLEDDGGEPP